MSKLFNIDSKVMRILATVGNLIILNFLWLIASAPIITIGASTTAMHAVVFKYAEDSEDAVFKPFFKAFASSFKQATLLWLPLCAALAILGLDAYYLISHAENKINVLLWIPFFIIFAIVAVIATYGFPLIARFENSLKDILRNSVLMFLLNFFASMGILILNLLPWAMMLVVPDIFALTSIFWVMLGGSLIAFFNAKVFLKIFRKYGNADEQENTQEILADR